MTTLALGFLNPVAGIVAGATAGLLVLSLYFLKLRRRPVRVSTTQFWEEAAQDLQANAPFRWIQPTVLLFLQLLLVALLALALARPTLDRPIDAAQAVLLIDRSASMKATDGGSGATRFEEAQRAAARLVENLPDGAAISVIGFAAEARSVVSGEANKGRIIAAIESMTPTDQPGDLSAALRVVSAITARAEETDDEAPPPLVAIITDGGVAMNDTEPVPLGGARVEFVGVGPEPAADTAAQAQANDTGQTDDDAATPSPSANAGIVGLSAKRDYDNPALVRVFVRVGSNDPGREVVGLTIALDGQPIETAPLRLAPVEGEANRTAGRLARAGSRTFEITAPAGGVVTALIDGAGGALASDDTASIVLTEPRRPRVLLVRADDVALTPGSRALEDALRVLGPRELVVERRGVVLRDGLAQSAAGAGTAGFDLVVLDGVSLDEPVSIPTLAFGAAPQGSRIELDTRESDAGVVDIAFWERDHPVMRFVTLDDVLIDRPLRMRLPGDGSARTDDAARDAADAPASVVRAESLATGPRSPLIAIVQGGVPRTIVVAFTLDQTDWWRKGSFPLFIANAVDHLALAVESGAGRQVRTAESTTLDLPLRGQNVTATLSGPGGMNTQLRPGPSGRVTIAPLETAGVYEIAFAPSGRATGDGGRSLLLAANLLSEHETSLEVVNELAVPGAGTRSQRSGGLDAQEIWTWFAAAALALLVVEWLLFARRMAA